MSIDSDRMRAADAAFRLGVATLVEQYNNGKSTIGQREIIDKLRKLLGEHAEQRVRVGLCIRNHDHGTPGAGPCNGYMP